MEKFRILQTMQEFFDKNVASKDSMPVECNGTDNKSLFKWMQSRGYFQP